MPKYNRYQAIIAKIFLNHFKQGKRSFTFERSELIQTAGELNVDLPKNLGDLIYTFRFRNKFPQSIIDKAPEGWEWIIELAGQGNYRFRLTKISRIVPNNSLVDIKIPDATPEIINQYALSDEQAVLAKVRYNRLIDIFLGITTYSLQNHLRTTVKGVGQIEIDEIYVGINNQGSQFIIPVQAKGGKDQIGIVQTMQDIACCEEKYLNLICRPIASQFMDNNKIAMFELTLSKNEIKIADEKHYKLTPSSDISEEELLQYKNLMKY